MLGETTTVVISSCCTLREPTELPKAVVSVYLHSYFSQYSVDLPNKQEEGAPCSAHPASSLFLISKALEVSQWT